MSRERRLLRRRRTAVGATGAKDCRGVSKPAGRRRVKRQRTVARHFNAHPAPRAMLRQSTTIGIAGRHRPVDSRIVLDSRHIAA